MADTTQSTTPPKGKGTTSTTPPADTTKVEVVTPAADAPPSAPADAGTADSPAAETPATPETAAPVTPTDTPATPTPATPVVPESVAPVVTPAAPVVEAPVVAAPVVPVPAPEPEVAVAVVLAPKEAVIAKYSLVTGTEAYANVELVEGLLTQYATAITSKAYGTPEQLTANSSALGRAFTVALNTVAPQSNILLDLIVFHFSAAPSVYNGVDLFRQPRPLKGMADRNASMVSGLARLFLHLSVASRKSDVSSKIDVQLVAARLGSPAQQQTLLAYLSS